MNTENTPEKVRKTRYDKGMTKVNDRDLHLIPWIGQQYAARFDHVYELISDTPGRGVSEKGLSESAARQVIQRWRQAGWVSYQPLIAGDPPWLWLSKEGIQAFGLTQYHTAAAPAYSRLRHIHAVNAVRLILQDDDDEWISEREIRAGKFYQRGETGHTPDAILKAGSGEVICIEVELTIKKPDELFKILYEVLNERQYEKVWYYVTDEDVEKALLTAQSKQPQNREKMEVIRFSIEELDTVGDDDDEEEEEGN